MNHGPIIGSFKNKTVLVVGDAMVDKYVWGSVKRISPEAPVPVVLSDKETFCLGGAANVSANIVSLGGKCIFVSIIGNDCIGDWLLSELNSKGIDCSGIIKSENAMTIQKVRVMGENRQLLRIDYEQKSENKHVDELMDFIGKRIGEIDSIIISDYDKGLINKEIAERIIKLGKKTIVDPKPANMEFYKNAFLVKPNKSEIEEYFRISFKNEEKLVEAGFTLSSILSANILITRGKDGLLLIEKNGGIANFMTDAKEVYDVTGAGDTVTAVLGLALASGLDFNEAINFANIAAGIKVSKMGTVPVSASELIEKLQKNQSKIKNLEEIKEITDQLKNNSKKIVFTNGCFDILHIGHTRLLEAAKSHGDVLIIGLNSDSSIKKIKGPDRPIIPENERAELLSALSCIDYIVFFEEDTPINLIKELQPEVIVKGGDYAKETVCGADFVEQKGGKVVIVPLVKDKSTTGLIGRISGGSK